MDKINRKCTTVSRKQQKSLCWLLFDPPASEYEKVQIPKRLRQFDIYTSIGLEKTSDAATYAVVARSTDDTDGKSHLARLYYSRLGLASETTALDVRQTPNVVYWHNNAINHVIAMESAGHATSGPMDACSFMPCLHLDFFFPWHVKTGLCK